MFVCVSTVSTLKIKCIDQEQENDNPPGHCCLACELASILKFGLYLKPQHFSSDLMTLGALIKA